MCLPQMLNQPLTFSKIIISFVSRLKRKRYSDKQLDQYRYVNLGYRTPQFQLLYNDQIIPDISKSQLSSGCELGTVLNILNKVGDIHCALKYVV